MAYPVLPQATSVEELAADFTLLAEEREAARVRAHGDHSRLAFAVLACCHRYLGYPPRDAAAVPKPIVSFVAQQLGVPETLLAEFEWGGRTWRRHLEECRNLRRWRPCEKSDHGCLVSALVDHGNDLVSRKAFLEQAVVECRRQSLELPTEKELRRIANAARKRFMDATYTKLSGRLSDGARRWLKELLETDAGRGGGMTMYEWLRSRPGGRLGVKTLLGEVDKLNHLHGFGLVDVVHLDGVSEAVLESIATRALSENTERMKRHRPTVRDALITALCWKLRRRITDRVVRAFTDLLHRCDKKADEAINKVIVKQPRKAFNAKRWLRKVAQVYFAHPRGTFEEHLLPVVPEEVLREAAAGDDREATYDQARNEAARQKYCHYYRQMVRPVLDALAFHADGETGKALVDAVKLVRDHFDSRAPHYPEDTDVPQSVIAERWRPDVFVEHRGRTRINRHFYELAVLDKLKESVKRKDAWVDGAYKYRNPSEDLPQDWEVAKARYYAGIALPMDAKEFIAPIREEMATALEEFNTFLGTAKADVRISFPGGGKRGVFLVPRVRKRPERPVLRDVRAGVLERWGIVELLDMLVEADRQVDLAQFFVPVTERQVLSAAEVRERVLVGLFGIGTNLGLKRVHIAARPSCSYESLVYFCRRFVTEVALRESNAALVNRILALRDPAIWGRGTACASDAKHMTAWDQNLFAERNPHYAEPGVMAYWHVDTNATCIHATSHRTGASQTHPMIEGLVRHDTEMRVESNSVDSHGQSEVAFAITRMLGIELLPRLKRIKAVKLYSARKGSRKELLNLRGVLERAIRWSVIEQQYDDMVRHVVALSERTGPVDSILRRFSGDNPSLTYKAFLELGKAQKTIFVCRYLSDPELRRQINTALNIVESWNAVLDFIFYGRRSELQTNDEDAQRRSILALQLLQNAVILANTVMVERVLASTALGPRMKPDDYRSLTPLFTQNINPYGQFTLDLARPSFLGEAA